MTDPINDAMRDFAIKSLNDEAGKILQDEWIMKPVREWTVEQKIEFVNEMSEKGTLMAILQVVQDIRDGQINHD